MIASAFSSAPGILASRLAISLMLLCFVGCGGNGITEEPKSFPSFDTASVWYSDHAITEQMTPSSTAIAWAGYCGNSNRKVLLIAFTSKPSKRYVYEGVPGEVWAAFKAADSKGKFYNSTIKGRYRFGL